MLYKIYIFVKNQSMRYLLITLFFISFSVSAQDQLTQTSLEYQQHLNEEFADSLKSPLRKEDRAVFNGLDFYKIDEKYIVNAIFIRTKREKTFKMKTSTNRTSLYKKYRELYFTLDGKEM